MKNFNSHFSNKFSSKKWISIGILLIIIISAIVIFSGYNYACNDENYLPYVSDSTFIPLIRIDHSVELKNSWYKLNVDRLGRVSVKTIKGEVIMSNLLYYCEPNDEIASIGLKDVNIQCTNDSTILIQGKSNENIVFLSIEIHQLLSKIDVKVRTVYGSNTIVNREALIAKFEVPVAEVYQINRKIGKKNLGREYWLQNEGVRFGSNERSALVYHTPFISSLQLDTKKQLLFFNLEYYLDHPYVNWPYEKDSTKWNNSTNQEEGNILSKAIYEKGSERRNKFSIYFNNLPNVTPRLMLIPNGYQAGYIFTEHADNGNIRTQRAAYFGAEDILNMDESKGGFVGHKIPVTKSIFYSGNDGISGSSIFGDSQDSTLLHFLDQIYSTGIYEICLHSPENLTSNRSTLEESIRFMKERYDTKTWIDHGFFNGNTNREAFVADGLDSTSQYYAADLWKKYGTQYFWSPAVEELRLPPISVKDDLEKFKFYSAYVHFWQNYFSPDELRELGIFKASKEIFLRRAFKSERNFLMNRLGMACPSPLYWKHPTRTNQFYSWATYNVNDYSDINQKAVDLEEIKLNKLINDWGIFIEHGYYVRTSEFKKNILSNFENKLFINPYFDQLLGFMAKKRDNGELYITTIKELLDYWKSLNNVSFEYFPNNTIKIINNNKKPIFGLSLVISTDSVLVNKKVPFMKQIGEEKVFWFDIDANEIVYLQIK